MDNEYFVYDNSPITHFVMWLVAIALLFALVGRRPAEPTIPEYTTTVQVDYGR